MLNKKTILGWAGLSAAIAVISALAMPQSPVLAQTANCSGSPQDYLAEYQKGQTNPKNSKHPKPPTPLSMVCYQYAVQRDPSAIAPVTTAKIDRKTLLDIFGKQVRDKEIFEEIWRPLPGFLAIFYDEKTLTKFYTGGTNKLQIPGTSTLGDNLFKVSITVDCDNFKLQYTGVARRLTRVYDYSDRYQIPGAFAKENVEQLCYELGTPPAKIGL